MHDKARKDKAQAQARTSFAKLVHKTSPLRRRAPLPSFFRGRTSSGLDGVNRTLFAGATSITVSQKRLERELEVHARAWTHHPSPLPHDPPPPPPPAPPHTTQQTYTRPIANVLWLAKGLADCAHSSILHTMSWNI